MVGAGKLTLGIFVGLWTGVPALKVGCAGTAPSFDDFVKTHGRQYARGSEEYELRRALFDSRVSHISSHNCADEHQWKAQINHLADWTEQELRSLRGYKKAYTESSSQGGSVDVEQFDMEEAQLPESVSWDYLDAIRRPMDQGQCGSCWAYAATAALNAHAEINNKTTKFSVAQIIACTPNPHQCGGAGGCEGATAELAYEYALQTGLTDEASFPARPGGRQAKCPSDKEAPAALLSTGITTQAVLTPEGAEKHMLSAQDAMRGGLAMGMLGWTKLPENKERPLVRALVEYGPLAVAVAAGSDWNWYFQGIMTPQGCDKSHIISHAVVLYGYGKANSVKRGMVKYWHIKNSWSRNWGEDGNIRLQRLDEEEKECGWDHQPEVGSGCKGGPSRVWVCGSCGILYDTVMPMFRL